MSTQTNKDTGEGESVIGKLGQGMNYDFCPQFNDYVYWLKKPFGWVICGAIFSALVGFIIGPQGFVLMWSFIALLVVGAVWPWLGMKGVDCTLRFKDARTHEGEPTRATLEIRNRWPIPIFGLMVEGEFLQDIEEEDDRIAVGLQRIPGWSVCKFEWSFEPERRGTLPVQQPIVANGFPFGIYRSEKEIEIHEQTIVWPQRQELQGQPDLQGKQFNIEGLMSDRTGEDGEIIGVRSYRQGDSLRNVHWQKTAQGRDLVVKERQICAQKPIQVVLDLSPESHRGSGSQSSYEWAIRVAANICQQLHRGHSQVEVICYGLATGVNANSTNRRGMTPLLDFFAMLPQYNSEDFEKSPSIDSIAVKPGVQTIMIRTNESQLSNLNQNCIPVVLSVEGFTSEADGENPFASQTPRNNAKSGSNAIVVASPSSASDDLVEGWKQGCDHAV